jgi:hypothetical protein
LKILRAAQVVEADGKSNPAGDWAACSALVSATAACASAGPRAVEGPGGKHPRDDAPQAEPAALAGTGPTAERGAKRQRKGAGGDTLAEWCESEYRTTGGWRGDSPAELEAHVAPGGCALVEQDQDQDQEEAVAAQEQARRQGHSRFIGHEAGPDLPERPARAWAADESSWRDGWRPGGGRVPATRTCPGPPGPLTRSGRTCTGEGQVRVASGLIRAQLVREARTMAWRATLRDAMAWHYRPWRGFLPRTMPWCCAKRPARQLPALPHKREQDLLRRTPCGCRQCLLLLLLLSGAVLLL